MVKRILFLVFFSYLFIVGCSNNRMNKEESGNIDITKESQEISKASLRKVNKDNVVTLAEIKSLNPDSIESFQLPPEAVLLSELNIRDSLYYLDKQLFTGSAYSLFENKQISQFKTMKNGRLSGPAYAWYEDGSYAMEANFLDGYLAGRFIAWSEVGDLIYDIYFDKGQFQSDLQYERDSAREEQEMDTTEGDGDSESNSGE